MKPGRIEIMDTTLRDGEQTSGVSFTAPEKLTLARLLLEELRVDRIEVASARVSDGEFESVRQIALWAKEAGVLQKVEVLSFVDGGASLEWIHKAGARTQNLLTKGSLNHLTYQLRKTPQEHFNEVAAVLKRAQELEIRSNVYLEDWSNGMRSSKEYVFDFLDFLRGQPLDRILLPDTLGILTPDETGRFIKEIVQRYPELHFDFHGHNDYDLSVANVLQALQSGIHGLHLTVNGMGERAGNAPLA
ncbi:MAG: 2-isopropylmalate synthase, partial [Robiginitalea sp.]